MPRKNKGKKEQGIEVRRDKGGKEWGKKRKEAEEKKKYLSTAKHFILSIHVLT